MKREMYFVYAVLFAVAAVLMLLVFRGAAEEDAASTPAQGRRACNAVLAMHNWRECHATAAPNWSDCWHVAGTSYAGEAVTARVCCTDVRCDAHGD